jgi:hypothetical protein
MQLVTALLPEKPEFSPGSLSVGFVVNKVSLF